MTGEFPVYCCSGLPLTTDGSVCSKEPSRKNLRYPLKQPFFSLTPSQTPGHPLFRLKKRPEETYFRVQFAGKYIKRGEKWAIPKTETWFFTNETQNDLMRGSKGA